MKCLTYFELSWVSRFELWNFLRSEQRAAHNNNNKKRSFFRENFHIFNIYCFFYLRRNRNMLFLGKKTHTHIHRHGAWMRCIRSLIQTQKTHSLISIDIGWIDRCCKMKKKTMILLIN